MRKIPKKAEIGETVTWLVATLIIVVLLAISIFVSSLIGSLNYEDLSIQDKSDLLVTKSLTSYLMTEDVSGKIIFNQIKEDKDLNDFNAPLSLKIFTFYEEEYSRGIYLDIRGKDAKLSGGSIRKKYYEEYFQKKKGKSEYIFSIPTDLNIQERIYIDSTPINNKLFALLGMRK